MTTRKFSFSGDLVLFSLLFAAAYASAPVIGPKSEVAWAAESLTAEDSSLVGRDCKQTVSNIQAPLERVAPYMDSRFHCSREELGVCMVAYRMLYCPDMSVNGGSSRPLIWTEFGVRVRPPNGVPDNDHVDTHILDGHDYYMLFFHTSDEELARRFERLGAPGLYVPDLRFDFPRADGIPLPFAGLEVVPDDGGTYRVTATALLPEEISEELADLAQNNDLITPFHLHTYYTNSDGHIVRYEEFRSNVTGHVASQHIEYSDETLLHELTGQNDTSFNDIFVLFDIEARVELFEDSTCIFDPLCNLAPE